MLIKPYVRPLWRDQGIKIIQKRLNIPLTLKTIKNQRNYVANLNKEAKLEYFSKFESNDNKPFWVNCKPYFTNKHSKAETDIMLSENGALILKTRKLRIFLMIILDPLSKTLAWITPTIILYHRRKVLKGLKISSNGIKTTRALETLKQILKHILFAASLCGWCQDSYSRLENNKSVSGETPI